MTKISDISEDDAPPTETPTPGRILFLAGLCNRLACFDVVVESGQSNRGNLNSIKLCIDARTSK